MMISCKEKEKSNKTISTANDSLFNNKTINNKSGLDSITESDNILKFKSNVSFNDFKVDTNEKKQKAPIDFTSNKNALNFKTRLIDEYDSEEPNFAGHYSFVFWGCGTACQSSLLIDRNTGKIYDSPSASLGYEFHVYSRMIIINPPDANGFYDNCSYCKPTIYIFDETSKKFKENKESN